MKEKYIKCSCGTVEHTLQFVWEENPEWPEIYISTFLARFGFFKRLWYGIKYIFGFRSKYGYFEETILDYKKVKELKEFCDQWLETHADPFDAIRCAEIHVNYLERKLKEAKRYLNEANK